ncbi:unnamed protein product, partial [Ixodes persulcatus]
MAAGGIARMEGEGNRLDGDEETAGRGGSALRFKKSHAPRKWQVCERAFNPPPP